MLNNMAQPVGLNWLARDIKNDQPQNEVSFKRIELFKEENIGIGSYGAVCKAKCDDLICAAKILHPTLFVPTAELRIARNKERRLPMKRFEQECEFMSTIKHPNIVQYLGVHRDPETRLPVLLMELMDNSLTNFLESSQEPISFHIQVNFCHDIAVALSFLHSNDIVHRDMSSNNVLLIGNSRAKVADFGMAKLGNINPQATCASYTLCPGTDAYMPPEATTEDTPRYTEKIDCFSFGVLCIQILTREFPQPGNRMKKEIFHGRRMFVCQPEVERRQNHISLVDPNHPLQPIVLDCLKDKDVERPSAQELCHRIAALKQTSQYTVSETSATLERKNAEIRELQQQLQGKNQDIEHLEHQLETSKQLQKRQVQDLEQQIVDIQQQHSSTLQAKQQENELLRQELRDKDTELEISETIFESRLVDELEQLQNHRDPSQAQHQESNRSRKHKGKKKKQLDRDCFPQFQIKLDRAQALKQQGNEFYKQQKYKEALKCYQEAIDVCPKEKKEDIAIFHQNLAAVCEVLAIKTTDKDQRTSLLNSVVKHCTQALSANPRYVKAINRRLKAHEALGKKRDALLDINRIVELDVSQSFILAPTMIRLINDIAQEQAVEDFPKLGPLAPTKYMLKTFFDSYTWNDDLSESRLRKLWDKQIKPTTGAPQSAELFKKEPFVKAASMFRRDKHCRILELLTEAIDNGNAVFLSHALLLRGALYTLWRQHKKALKDLQEVVNMQGLSNEMYTNALIHKAGIFAGQGEMDKVHGCFDKCFAIKSDCADAYIHRARLLLESSEDPKQMECVIKDLNKGLKMEPKSAYGQFSLASAYHRLAGMNQSMQILEQATAKFEEAMRKFPDFSDGMVLYASFLQKSGKFRAAEDLLNTALKVDSRHPRAHLAIGLLSLLFNGDVEKAVACMETAITLDNSCVQAYAILAAIKMQSGNSKLHVTDLYSKSIQYCRSQVDMSQVYVSREITGAQYQWCNFGNAQRNLAARSAMPF